MSNEKIGFADSTFDTIVDTFGVCSVHNPIAVRNISSDKDLSFINTLQMLHELARVCKEDGKILLLEHGMSKWSWITSYLNGYPLKSRPFLCFMSFIKREMLIHTYKLGDAHTIEILNNWFWRLD